MTPPPPKPPDAPLQVCLVALHALPVVDPHVSGPVGGTETRAWTIARGLAARDEIDVSLVVRVTGKVSRTQVEKVRILPRIDRLYPLYESIGHCLEKRHGFPWISVRQWNPALLWQVPALMLARPFDPGHRDPRQPEPFYREIPADVFGTFGVQSNSARVIAAAHASGRPAVLLVGSDGDLDERYVSEADYVSPYGDRAEICRFILQEADAIVVQTERQQRLLQERFAREATVLANPFDVQTWDAAATRPLSAPFADLPSRFVLWVGRAEEIHKRPGLCLDLARLCPEVPFLMVVNPRDRGVEERLHSERPANVHIIPQVRPDEMPALFCRAAAFVSTSSLEGFPNVFLQAAVSGVPIGSLAVGADFLQAAGAGVCTKGDLSQLANFVRQAWADDGKHLPLAPLGVGGEGDAESRHARSGREYVLRQHAVSRQMDVLHSLLLKVAGRVG